MDERNLLYFRVSEMNSTVKTFFSILRPEPGRRVWSFLSEEEITSARVSVRYRGVRCPLNRHKLSWWGCYWRGVLFVSARDGRIAAQLWERWAEKFASDWDAWTKGRIAQDLPHLGLAEARELLGVAEDYERADVMRAFRKLAHKHHPAHGGNAELATLKGHLAALTGADTKLEESLAADA